MKKYSPVHAIFIIITELTLMNKRLIRSILIFLGIISIYSCDKSTFDRALYDCEGEDICRKGNGQIFSTKFQLPENMESFIWDNGIDLEITQSDSNYIAIESEENLFDLFKFNNYNKEVRLDFDDCFCSTRAIKAQLFTKNLKQLFVSGNGVVQFHETFKSSEFKLISTGDNSLFLNADIEYLTLSKMSNSDFTVEGRIDRVNLTLTGNGNYNAIDCIMDSVAIESFGKGNTNMTVRKYLEATIYGSGDLCYRGRPQIDFEREASGNLGRCK